MDISNAKILIVDDDPMNLDLLASVLKPAGYRIRRASDGVEALKSIQEEAPDLVLLDVMMPNLSGYEVCKRIKSDPATQFVPVVLVTALDDRQSKITGIKAGADDFINKPTDISELRARVQTSLRMKFLHEEVQDNYRKLKAAEQMRENLTHMIVHDLRNPLMSMVASLDLFEMKVPQEEKYQVYIQRLQRCARILMDMVNAMLDVAKLEAGEMNLTPCEVSIQRLCEEVQDYMTGLLETRQLTLESEFDEALPALWADREFIRRILVNILGNAIHFSPVGCTIRMNVRRKEDEVEISVHDQGKGIPEEHQARVFDKFVNYDDEGNLQRYSTGLGLAFCKMAVEASGGRIGLISKEEEGSTFWFTLPARKES